MTFRFARTSGHYLDTRIRVAMEQFPYNWRFENTSIVYKIVDRNAATAIWTKYICADALHLMQCQNRPMAFNGPIDLVSHLWGRDEEACTLFLMSCGFADHSDTVIVFWGGEWAVYVNWLTFAANWSYFFYPSDDSCAILRSSAGKYITYIEDRFQLYTVNKFI